MARILVVDDSLIMRKNLTSVFTAAGHLVVAEARNGQEAVMLYKKHLPHLVTMDITMPIMDGIQATKTIISEFPKAKIVVISSHGQESMVFKAISSGAVYYLLKPINQQKIEELIEEVCPEFKDDNGPSESSTTENAPVNPDKPSESTDSVPVPPPVPEKSEKKIDPTFDIINEAGVWQITVKNEFAEANLENFKEAIDGILMNIPLNTVIDLGDLVGRSSAVKKGLREALDRIRLKNGIRRVFTDLDDITSSVRSNNRERLDQLFS